MAKSIRQQIEDDDLSYEEREKLASKSLGWRDPKDGEQLEFCPDCENEWVDESGQCHYCEPALDEDKDTFEYTAVEPTECSSCGLSLPVDPSGLCDNCADRRGKE